MAKILKRISEESNRVRTFNGMGSEMRECDDPDHWDWQSYLVSFKRLKLVYSTINLRKAKPMIAITEMTHVWLLNKFFSVSNVGSKSTHETVENLPPSFSLNG